MSTCNERWERFLDPEVLRPSLLMATMFITTFEILKNSIVDHIRSFFSDEWSREGPIASAEYRTEVLSRHKSPVYASLDWLRENQVISDDDLVIFNKLKTTRNLVAHELFNIVTGETECNHIEQFEELVALLRKIEVWWVVNVDIATNPDYADVEIDEAGIVPGAILSLQMLLQVMSGNTELLEAWRNRREKR